MQTDTELALLRAIHANPGEDTPRLMYIDHCLEYDPDRAELIYKQTELDGVEKHIPMRTKERTIRADIEILLAKNADRWLRVRCPECIAGLVPNLTGGKPTPCTNCNATGDMCRFTHPGTPSRDPFKVEWKAGFPHKVTGAKHADVFRQMVVPLGGGGGNVGCVGDAVKRSRKFHLNCVRGVMEVVEVLSRDVSGNRRGWPRSG